LNHNKKYLKQQITSGIYHIRKKQDAHKKVLENNFIKGISQYSKGAIFTPVINRFVVESNDATASGITVTSILMGFLSTPSLNFSNK
jgi:hypothetical protein